jgi:uncharacterized protein
MIAFADTSALFAVMDRDDRNHEVAVRAWERLLSEDARLLVTNYVLVESFMLIQRRLGMAALRAFAIEALPALEIHWLSAEEHTTALQALITADRRRLSFVDCASFVAMRGLGVRHAFTFDRHFFEQGFEEV